MGRRIRAWGVGVATVLVTITGITGIAGPARAGGPDEPIIADVNGDGRPDRSVLSYSPAGDGTVTCRVIVRLGTADGGHGAARSYPYLRLPADGAYCPDMGIGLNLDADREDELAVTWFGGAPHTVGSNLLVLDRFAVTGGFQTLFQPSYIGTADFNGDRRPDIYQWTDQGEGFVTYLNTGNGSFIPGPLRHCAGRIQPRLTDFDRDRAMDVVIAYAESCADFSSGVVVLLADGGRIDLEHDPDGVDTWQVKLTDANGDGRRDVITRHDATGASTTHLASGDGTFVANPRAIRDYPRVRPGRTTTIDVLANDYASRDATITIWSQPRHGTVRVTRDRTVVYTPAPGAGRHDSFVYRVAADGRVSNATVQVRVG
jgi:hypothetical protein